MSNYISLNPHTQLEQVIADDLQSALGKRGLSVIHNGTSDSHTPGGKPDIIVFDENYVLIIEVTRSKGSAQDREFQSIRSHLKETKEESPRKLCFCIFISPKTSDRTLDSIHDYNLQRVSEEKPDMKILPLTFEGFKVWVTRLKESTPKKYPMEGFISIFEQHEKFISDLDIQKIFEQIIFSGDEKTTEIIEQKIPTKSLGLPLDESKYYSPPNKLEISRLEGDLGALVEYFLHYSTLGWNRFAKTTGISITQFNIMTQIYERGIWNISEIGNYFGITVPAASQLVDKLVQSELVHRVEDQKDRRSRQLRLSSKGAKLADDGIQERYRWLNKLTAMLSADERAKVTEALNILTEKIRKLEK